MSVGAAHPPLGLPGSRRGLTLIELVTALAILSILLAAMTSAIFLASRAWPTTDDRATATVQSQSVLDWLAGELSNALYIVDRTPTSITFTVPDRNNDGLPERIGYAWSGTAGAPLLRTYNGSPPQILFDRVNLFTLAFDNYCLSDPYPGTAVEDAFDSLLAEAGDDSGLQGDEIRANRTIGQYLKPLLDSTVVGWRPTRVKFRTRNADPLGRTWVQLRRPDAHLRPTSTVLCQETLEWGELPSSWSWVEKAFSSATPLPPDSGVCLVLQYRWAMGSTSVRVQYDENTPFGLLTSADAQQWTFDNARSLRCQLYGRLTRSGPTQYAVHRYLRAVQVDLRPTALAVSRLSTCVNLLNCPELLLGYWEADFSSDPTVLDNNGDGLGDFVRADGLLFNPASLSGGLWQADAVLRTHPAQVLPGLIILETRMRATSPGGQGAVVWLNTDRAADGSALGVEARLRLENDQTQTLEVFCRTGDGSFVSLVTVPGLSAALASLELWLDTQRNSVHVRVNGVSRGTFSCVRFTPGSSVPGVGLRASGAAAQFDWVRVRVLEAGP